MGHLSHFVFIAGVICLFVAAFGIKIGKLTVSWGWLGLGLIYASTFIK